MKSQQGFTLIELMIALALGLVVTAAAMLLFLTAQKSYSLQKGMGNLQDNANFGLNLITKDIRLSNLNTFSSAMNDETSHGGIVLTSSVNATKTVVTAPEVAEPLSNLYKTIKGVTAETKLLSRSASHASNVSCVAATDSNVQAANTCKAGTALQSDQLTVQYKPQYVKDGENWFGGYDCEGVKIEFPVKSGTTVNPLRMIVQRYFLVVDDSVDQNESNEPLALACEAGWYSETGSPEKISRFDSKTYGQFSDKNPQIIMKRVDHFRVLLEVQAENQLRYISVADYMATQAGTRPRILAVQIGALMRSAQTVGSDAVYKADQQFTVLDQTVVVKKSEKNQQVKYVRQVVTQTVALRNTFGERGAQ